MASASGCSIAAHFTLHQPNASRHVENSIRCVSRSGAPVPERITRPSNSSYHTHLRRAPRSRPVIQQSSPPRDYQRAPRRLERLAQRAQTLPGTGSRRREEAPRHVNVPLVQPKPSSSRHSRPTEPFPARRPHRTRYSPSQDRYEGHRGASVDNRAPEDDRSGYTRHRTPEPPARHTRTARPSAPATNRWSFSSDSSTSSMECPATPTSSDVYVPWSHSYMEEFAREFEYVQQQEEFFARRRLEMQEEMGWATKPSLLSRLDKSKPPVPVVLSDNHNGHESLVDSCPAYEEDDVGQTTVYSDHEVITRDPRFFPPRERTQNLDRVLIEDRPKSRSTDETERRKGRIHGRRAAVFPMWAEPAPRDMLDKERDGIRFRFVDESLPVSRARCDTGCEEQPKITRRSSGGDSSSDRDIRDLLFAPRRR